MDLGGSIDSSYATGLVKGISITHDSISGGFVGSSSGEFIVNSYSTARIEGVTRKGGFIGWDSKTRIENCYAAGYVQNSNADYNAAGFLPYSASNPHKVSPHIKSSYWNISTTGQSKSIAGGTGKTTTQMRQKSTYSGWDFTNIWEIKEGQSYPTLQWQN